MAKWSPGPHDPLRFQQPDFPRQSFLREGVLQEATRATAVHYSPDGPLGYQPGYPMAGGHPLGPQEQLRQFVTETVVIESDVASRRTLEAYISTGNLVAYTHGRERGFLYSQLEEIFGSQMRKVEVFRERARWEQVRLRFAEAAGLRSFAMQTQSATSAAHAIKRLSVENRFLLRLVSMLRSAVSSRETHITLLAKQLEAAEKTIEQLSADRMRDRILVRAGAGIVQHQLRHRTGGFRGLSFALEWLGLVQRAHEFPVADGIPAADRVPVAGRAAEAAAADELAETQLSATRRAA